MTFEGWDRQQERDPRRARRLMAGYAIAAAVCFAAALAAVLAPSELVEVEEDDTAVAVSLVTRIEAPKPAPEPQPDAPRPTLAAVAPAGRPGPRPLATPTRLSNDVPKEADAPATPGGGDEEIYGFGDGSSAATGAPAPIPPPARISPPKALLAVAVRPPPKSNEPIALPDRADPPVAIAKPMPDYPDAARARGVEAVVVVKFVVDEIGRVQQCRIVQGHPLFDGAVLDAVKAWRFKPARFEGRAIAVLRTAKIPFRLRM